MDLLIDHKSRVLSITLNRPDTRNALSAALLKLTGQLGALVSATALRNGVVCLLAVVLMPHGLIGVAVAYVAGEAISLVIPAGALLRRSVWKVQP